MADFVPALLASERTVAQLSREELARAASRYEPCLSAAHVGLYELGRRAPQLSTLTALARGLGVEVRALLVPVDTADLARLRVEAGIRQRDLARMLGLTQARWSRTERGLAAAEAPVLVRAAGALGRSYDVVAHSAAHTRRTALCGSLQSGHGCAK
ncbi:helix-turn-helix domain-containing protein [Streptomyces alboflavus]|uniref:helix-turn-helix domain-containing protein n=1 Tax=Streptomyces alboflavus TaxID=67267 RepID=UPI0013316F05|nr:helix-turn-helix transcriptional regulator [Streptomyces alboflavus]